MTEIKIPREQIEEIARDSVNSDLVALRESVDNVRVSNEAAVEKLAAIEKFAEEMRRVQGERTEESLDSRHAGLHFDPSDRDDPVVKFFSLGAREDRINDISSVHTRGLTDAPGLRARGLGLRMHMLCHARYRSMKSGRTVEEILKDMGADWMVKQVGSWMDRESANAQRTSDEKALIARSLGTVSATSGASLIPQEYSLEIIELLRNATVFMAAGPVEIPLGPGGLNYGRITAASTATYKGEQAAILASQPSTGEITMHRRDLYAIVPMADAFYEAPRMAEVARNEAVRTLTIRADLAGLRGDGFNDTPRGIRSWVTDGSTPDRVVSSASADATPTTDELAQDIRNSGSLLAQSNVPGSNKAMFINPRTEWHVMYHTNADGNFPFKDEVMAGRLGMARLFSTNQIPVNLGGGTETEIMQADMAEVLHGIHQDVESEFFPAAAYTNSAGNVVAGVSTGETVLRVRFGHDVRVKHEEAITVIDSVLY